MSVRQLMARSGKNRYTVNKVIDELEIEGIPLNKNQTRRTAAVLYSYTNCLRILAKLEKIEDLPPLPGDYTSFPDLEAEMPNTSITSLARSLNIVPGRYANSKNQHTKGFSPDQRALMLAEYKERQSRTMIEYVAKQLGISPSQARKLATEALGAVHKSGLTAEEIAVLKQTPYMKTPKAQDGYKVKNVVVREYRISTPRFERAVEELGLSPKDLKTNDNRNQILPHWSPDQIIAIVTRARTYRSGNPSYQKPIFSASEPPPAAKLPKPTPQTVLFSDEDTAQRTSR